MSITRWQPFNELMGLRQAVDRLFEDSFVSPSRILGTFEAGVAMPIDMYHTADDVIVKATLPGVKPEEIDITINGDTLAIRGETKTEEEVNREDYFYQEHRYGAFNRSVNLPGGLSLDKVEATFDNGILTLTIPKVEKVKHKQIKVKAKGTIEGKK